MADAHPGWRFTGVDPAAPMLDLAAKIMGPDAARAELLEGTIDDAPIGPFDGATRLLTLPFLDRAERIRPAAEICRRLQPGSACVAAHGRLARKSVVTGKRMSERGDHGGRCTIKKQTQ